MNPQKPLLAGFVIGLFIALAPSCGTANTCNATTCRTGCCDSKGTCQLGSSNSACGQLGAVCSTCALGTACNLGTCMTTGFGGGTQGGGTGGSQGGGTGGSQGGGTGGSQGGGTGGAQGGGTGGAQGGGTGGGGGCDGCIANGSTCISLANSGTNSFCGRNGVTCATCSGSQTCQNYQCVGGTGGGGGTTGGGGGTTGGGGGTTLQPVGGACTSATQCQAGLTCRMTTSRGDATYTGGYCTKNCTTATDCSGSSCVGGSQSALPYYGETAQICMGACTALGDQSQSNCRAGYGCYGEQGTTGFCWLNPIPPFEGGGQATRTGSACTGDSQCTSPPSADFGFCFPPTLPDGGVSGFSQGYCSADCSFDNTGTFCGSAATCMELGTAPNNFFACLLTCTSPGSVSTCPTGSTCYDVGTGSGVCFRRCTATSCMGGMTCNSTTGQCQ